MPKIDETKVATFLNDLLTESISRGSDVVENLKKSSDNLTQTMTHFSDKIDQASIDVKSLTKELNKSVVMLPKTRQAIKISSMFASFAIGVALSGAIFLYSLSLTSFRYIESNKAHMNLLKEYSELQAKHDQALDSNTALSLELRALRNAVNLTLPAKNADRFNEIFAKEYNKLEKELNR